MGVDGCAAGWVCVLRNLRGLPPRVHVAQNFADLLVLRELPSFVAVDIPIGLPDRIGEAGRGPETLLRARLGERQSSVFAIPSRAAVACTDYEEACRVAAETSEPSRMVSKQAFFLFPKIRELDALMRADAGNAYFIHESHPEGVFMTMNDGQPLGEPKKRKGSPYPPGLELRRDLLTRVAGYERPFLQADLLRGVGDDDLLDACACAWTAERIARGTAISYPSPPLADALGIPIAIWT
jgi:predicted RNase H-like nuclease